MSIHYPAYRIGFISCLTGLVFDPQYKSNSAYKQGRVDAETALDTLHGKAISVAMESLAEAYGESFLLPKAIAA